jgi:hypothetical protein
MHEQPSQQPFTRHLECPSLNLCNACAVMKLYSRPCHVQWMSRSTFTLLRLLLQEYDPVCVSDEHYMPTLLASYGLDSETDCLGLATLSDWAHARGGHPSSFLPADLSPGLAVELKSQHTTGGKLRSDLPACDWEQAWASAAGGIFAAQPTLQATPNTPATHAPAHEQVRHWVLATGYRGVRSRCALFGRKFPGRSLFTYQAVTRPQDAEQVERATLQWALSCSVGLGLGPWCPLNQHHHAGAEARS